VARFSYVHRGGDVPLRSTTVDRCFQAIAARHPDRDAIVSIPQRRRLRYAELDAEVERLARGLLAIGADRGDRVGIWSTNNVEWILVQLATARIGALLVNVNPACRAHELEHALRLARVQILVTMPSFRGSRYVDMICDLCPEAASAGPGELRSERFPDLRTLIVFDPDEPRGTRRPASGFHTWQAALAQGESVPDSAVAERAAQLDPDDPINIQFTSGTTGAPKAVVLTHFGLVNNAWFAGQAMDFGPSDRLCVPVPFYHCFGMVLATLTCLTHGAAIIVPAPHFDAGATLAAIQSERCTAVHGVPTMFIAELECPERRSLDLSSLRTGIMAGAPCAPDLVKRVMQELGCPGILIGYGQTEASPLTHLTRPDSAFERRVATVGTNLPHQEVKVVDPHSGALLPLGEEGEVCLRGYHVMRGYYEQPDATRAAIDAAGWLHSGDLGALDADGYLRITGRLKDMIIRGGEKIHPAEIEALYSQHSAVAEVAVFGLPDRKLGEEVGAWIRLRDGSAATPEQLRAWARGRISHYKIPRHVWIVEEFPTTITGKVQKFRIQELARERLGRPAQPERTD
jgi:fatty-acyl-CoA synthase